MSKRLPFYLLLVVVLLTAASVAFAQGGGQPTATEAPPRVRVVHLAPFAPGVDDTAVTVAANGDELLSDFKFTNFTDYVALPGAGDYDIAVLVNGSPVIEETVTVAEDMDYTIAAIGGANGWSPELWVLEDDNSDPGAGAVRLRIAHAAPFAADLADTEVDICGQDGSLVAGLAAVPYKAASGYLTLPAGTYDLKITLADPTPCTGLPIIDPVPVELPEGAIATVFAYGDGNNQLPGILAVPLGVVDVIPPIVRAVHVAAFDPVPSATAVQLTVSGQLLPVELQYLESTEYLPLPAAGAYEFAVLAGGAVAVSDTFLLGAGTFYTVAAIGDGSNRPLELLLLVDDWMPPQEGNGKIRIVHAAPFAADLADTEVDICTQQGDLVDGLQAVPFGADSGFLSLPAGVYDLKVTAAAAQPCTGALVFDLPPFGLPDGGIATAFAVGGANGYMPGAYSPEVGRIGIPYEVYVAITRG